jgi:toxin FitB
VNLVDSSAWLEYFAGGPNAKSFAKVIEDTVNLIISSINLYEVYRKVLTEKDEDHAIQVAGLMQQAQVINVDSIISLSAAKISFEYKIPMADSIIYSTARLHDAVLWTLDADFEGLTGVRYIEKR